MKNNRYYAHECVVCGNPSIGCMNSPPDWESIYYCRPHWYQESHRIDSKFNFVIPKQKEKKPVESYEQISLI